MLAVPVPSLSLARSHSPALVYRSLSAWRGIACLSVLLFHSFGALLSTPAQRAWGFLEPIRRASDFGWWGVHLFFVISGFCISQKLASLAASGASPFAFWKNRILRIVPPYWAALAITAVLGVISSRYNHASVRDALPTSGLDLIGHLLLIEPYIGRPTFLLVSWTLTTELGFYAIAGLALWIPGGLRNAWLGGLALCTLPLAVPTLATHPVFGLWPDFFLGAAVFQVLSARPKENQLVCLAGLGAIAVIGGLAAWIGFGGSGRIVAALFALALIVLYPFDQGMAGGPPGRALGWLGLMSYSIYLVHAPFVSRTMNLGLRFVQPASVGYLPVWLLTIAVGLAAGCVFHRFCESPCERWRLRYERKQRG